jgi:hypothetical protein
VQPKTFVKPDGSVEIREYETSNARIIKSFKAVGFFSIDKLKKSGIAQGLAIHHYAIIITLHLINQTLEEGKG